MTSNIFNSRKCDRSAVNSKKIWKCIGSNYLQTVTASMLKYSNSIATTKSVFHSVDFNYKFRKFYSVNWIFNDNWFSAIDRDKTAVNWNWFIIWWTEMCIMMIIIVIIIHSAQFKFGSILSTIQPSKANWAVVCNRRHKKKQQQQSKTK